MSAILSVSLWRPSPGRLGDLLAAIKAAKPIFALHGGEATVLETMFGGEPGTIGVAMRFENWPAFGKFSQALEADDQWEKLRQGWCTEKVPIATLVRNGISRVIE